VGRGDCIVGCLKIAEYKNSITTLISGHANDSRNVTLRQQSVAVDKFLFI